LESAYWRPFEVLWLSSEESIAKSNSEFDACKSPALALNTLRVWQKDYQNLPSAKVFISVSIKF
jgi:hypothetical protein